MQKRSVDTIVISDVHLGTFGSRTSALLAYLNSVNTQTLILNGDFIDFWQLSSWYWPTSHTSLLEKLVQIMENGTQVYYLPGNHDELIRRFYLSTAGNFRITEELIFESNGKKTWIVHGDRFDKVMEKKWVPKLGAVLYGVVILLDRLINLVSRPVIGKPVRFSKKLKDITKGVFSAKNDFKKAAVDKAFEIGCDYLICGHWHRPGKEKFIRGDRTLYYLDSGDWIENLTALEYENGEWSIYYHPPHFSSHISALSSHPLGYQR